MKTNINIIGGSLVTLVVVFSFLPPKFWGVGVMVVGTYE